MSLRPSPPHIFRRGGPVALVTPLCHFAFDKIRARFRLESVHPGHSVEEVLDETGFAFDRPAAVPTTPLPSPEILALLRGTVAPELATLYPKFVETVFGIPISPHPDPPPQGGRG